MTSHAPEDVGMSRLRATLYVSPFLAVGLLNLVALVRWGPEPLWALAVLPPIGFVSAVGWLAFRSGFYQGPRARAVTRDGPERQG